MTTYHSPAPWHYRVSDHDPDCWEILAPFCESPIAEVPRWRDETGSDSLEAEANVILIAAAPRMHETLTYVAELLSSFKPDYLRQIGLDAALEESLDALSAAEPNVGEALMKRPDQKSGAITEHQTYVRELEDGVVLEAQISPCVFMYSQYPLQIQASLRAPNGRSLGLAYAADRSKTAQTATTEDVWRLLAAIGTVPCPRCSTPAFDPATVETNRGGLCEVCYAEDLDSLYSSFEEIERLKIVARDRRMKKAGMRCRVTAWVHLDGAGEDYSVHWYFADTPTTRQIAKRLRAEGSAITHDFTIVRL